jgi:hypothetical protein
MKDLKTILIHASHPLHNFLNPVLLTIRTQQMKKMSNTFKVPTKNDKKIVFWEAGGMPALLSIDAIIAYALRLRGTDVHMVICDGTYCACIKRDVRSGIPVSEWSKKCPQCKKM